MRFIGRKKELEELNILLRKKSASLVVIHGRRRIGKSRLIEEFVKDKKSWIFSGLPPVKGITRQRQIDTFAVQMSQNLNMPKLHVSEWSELFWHLVYRHQFCEHKFALNVFFLEEGLVSFASSTRAA